MKYKVSAKDEQGYSGIPIWAAMEGPEYTNLGQIL